MTQHFIYNETIKSKDLYSINLYASINKFEFTRNHFLIKNFMRFSTVYPIF